MATYLEHMSLLGLAPLMVTLALQGRDPLPRADMPEDTLLQREIIVISGPDWIGNWRSRVDLAGCWSVSHNTWMHGVDPWIVRSDAAELRFNGDFTGPWFCMDEHDLAALARAARSSRFTQRPRGATVVERWSWRHGDQVEVAVFPLADPPRGMRPLIDALGAIAGRGSWGASPEGSDVDTAATPDPE